MRPPCVLADDASAATDLNNLGVTEAKAGRFEQGVSLLRQAQALNPSDLMLRKNLSYMLTDFAGQRYREGKVDEAIALLQEAVDDYPHNGPALVHLGNLYYLHRNDFDRALETWRRAHGRLPTVQWEMVADRITQAERDRDIERRFATHATEHFQIRHPGPASQDAAARVGERLGQDYQRFAEELGVRPLAITVILYKEGDFRRLGGHPDWAIGFYDGRIRIRLEDVGTDREPWILAHELAHAFLHKAYGGRIPIWVHEGYAQVKEPPRPRTAREQTLTDGVKEGTLWIPLKWLDTHFEQPTDAQDLERAYGEARVTVEFLIGKYGTPRFREFLEALASGKPVDQAFDRAFAPSRWVRMDQGL